MKVLYCQKSFIIFLNTIAIILAVFGIMFSLFTEDYSALNVLFVSGGYSLLSLLFLVNKMYYNNSVIEFRAVRTRKIIDFCDIKEIYYSRDIIQGCTVIFNFSKAVSTYCNSQLHYQKECKRLGIVDTFYIVGMTYKDLNKLLDIYDGSIMHKWINI